MGDDIYYGLENRYVETFDDERLLEDVYAMIEQLTVAELAELREQLCEKLGM